MIQIRNILVPTDFSDDAANALEHARELALAFRARVHLLHVMDSSAHPREGVPAETEASLAALAASLDGLETETATRWGHPAERIVDYARKNSVDMIVMGTHGRRGLARLVLGSTTEKVVRISDCPVFSVRLNRQPSTDGRSAESVPEPALPS